MPQSYNSMITAMAIIKYMCALKVTQWTRVHHLQRARVLEMTKYTKVDNRVIKYYNEIVCNGFA